MLCYRNVIVFCVLTQGNRIAHLTESNYKRLAYLYEVVDYTGSSVAMHIYFADNEVIYKRGTADLSCHYCSWYC